MKLATLINKAVLLWMQHMVRTYHYEWYASLPKSKYPPTRLLPVFHAIENRYISELINVGVARRTLREASYVKHLEEKASLHTLFFPKITIHYYSRAINSSVTYINIFSYVVIMQASACKHSWKT